MLCAQCGGEIRQPSRGRRRVWCSPRCRYRARDDARLRRWAAERGRQLSGDWSMDELVAALNA
jgi:hypothetical protein